MPYGGQIEREAAIAALAVTQQGNVSREQLRQFGLGDKAIYHRCQSQRLFREHLGVYSVGRRAATPLERASAAVLACGPDAALSHSSALSLWGFVRGWSFPLHVTSPRQLRRPNIITHRAQGLAQADIRIELGIRVTSPARAMLDSAPDLPGKRLARIAADARRTGHLHLDQVADVLTRFPHHHGNRKLHHALEGLGAPTRSEFEDAFLRFCERYGLPTPLVNVRFAGHEVDAYFAAERLIVELDGWNYHRDRHSFEGDRDRDADALAHGAPTVRITWERMIGAPDREADRLRTILRGRVKGPGNGC